MKMPKDHHHPPRTRRDKAAARRQQILEAALDLFANQGFSATTTKQIAERVGVTEGLIFHYFPSKAELLRALTRQRSTIMGEVQALLAEADGKPASQVLQSIVLGWADVIHRQSNLVSMLLAESQSNDELANAFRDVMGETIGAMAEYLEGRVRAGELRADLSTETSALMFFSSLMMFFLANRQLEESAWSRGAAAFTASLLDTWFHGARAPEHPAPTHRPPAKTTK